MLDYFKDNDLVYYPQEKPTSWEEAIRVSCEKLIEHGYASKEYPEAIISSVKEHGPYIALIPGVAMPHAPVTSDGVLGTAISLTVFKEDVMFQDEQLDEEKNAKLFFTLVAKDDNKHLENITKLTTLLQDDEILQQLLSTDTLEDYKKIQSKKN